MGGVVDGEWEGGCGKKFYLEFRNDAILETACWCVVWQVEMGQGWYVGIFIVVSRKIVLFLFFGFVVLAQSCMHGVASSMSRTLRMLQLLE